MRALALWILAFGIAASPAIARAAGTGDDKDSTAAKPAGTAKAATDNKTPDASSKSDAPAKPASPTMENELQQLRELLEAQSKQLQEQNDALKEQRHEMEAMQQNLRAVNAPLVNEGALPASSLAADPAFSNGFVASADQDKPDAYEIRFKGITLKPGGFLAAEGVWRQRGSVSTVNTDFKSIPMPGASQSKLADLEFTGRQSQLSMLAEGKVDSTRLRGYVETDFLSAGVTSTNTESNSYTLRMRQAWGQAATDSGWEVTGGQMWSLVTETKKGTEPLTEAKPMTIDAQYTAGFSWARQFGFRVSKSFGDKFTLAVSAENSSTTFVAHGFAITNTTTIPAGATGTAVLLTTATSIGNTLVGNIGDTSGLENNQNNYSYNSSPDFVVKGAIDPGWGHYEIFGVVGTVKARIFPCATASVALPCADGTTSPSAFGANNDIRTTGGIGANARVPLFNKHLDAGIHFLGGDGIGRYGTTTLQDVTVRPNGTLVPLRSYQALGTLELHATPKLDIYAYVGGEYLRRASYINPINGVVVGYGSNAFSNKGCNTETLPSSGNTALTSINLSGGTAAPTKTGLSPTAYNGFLPGALGSCTADTRNIIEGTLGFWYRFYQGPKGRLQSGIQYSYAVRNTWAGTTTSSETFANPTGSTSMVFTSFRYYLP